ncbi:hypothetical protein BDQ17DRAFT_1424978 [Cyathus striatus]|nr:hypothetical protein BDQ17DRAFT_1424978 [Cyathus striatus]
MVDLTQRGAEQRKRMSDGVDSVYAQVLMNIDQKIGDDVIACQHPKQGDIEQGLLASTFEDDAPLSGRGKKTSKDRCDGEDGMIDADEDDKGNRRDGLEGPGLASTSETPITAPYTPLEKLHNPPTAPRKMLERHSIATSWKGKEKAVTSEITPYGPERPPLEDRYVRHSSLSDHRYDHSPTYLKRNYDDDVRSTLEEGKPDDQDMRAAHHRDWSAYSKKDPKEKPAQP